MGQLLLVLLARSTAESPDLGPLGPGAVLKAAVDAASLQAALLAPQGDRPPVTPAPPLPPPPAARLTAAPAARAAHAAIESAAQRAAEDLAQLRCEGPCQAAGTAGTAVPREPREPSFGLSAEVAALVKAAKAKEWRPEPSQVEDPAPPRANDQAAFLRREAHRRWQIYLKMAQSRLKAPQSGDAVEEYHLLYEVINQIIAGLQLAAEASQGRGAELSQGFSLVAQLLSSLHRRSHGTPFENEDFAVQAEASAFLGCGNRPWEERRCDVRRLRRWMEAMQPGAWSPSNRSGETSKFQDSWIRYLDLGFAKGLWRQLSDHHVRTFNPSEVDEKRSMWQLFPTYIMAKDLRTLLSSTSSEAQSRQSPETSRCTACRHLTHIVLDKYHDFKEAGFANPHRPDEVNNAFFTWQLTHDAEQRDEEGHAQWPELYGDSTFGKLKALVKSSCVEYLQEIYSSTLSNWDLEHLELSIWASVTSPRGEGDWMGLAFHDHPLSLLSGVFYADAGGDALLDRTPTVFADPRGVTAFRYAGDAGGSGTGRERLEPMAPFHRLAYSHAKTGMSLVFPSWLVHGVAPHHGPRDRVVFAYNLHHSPGSTLDSWAKTTL